MANFFSALKRHPSILSLDPPRQAGIFFKGLKLADLAPESPSIANFLTGEVMGHNADRLSDRFGISRLEQASMTILLYTTILVYYMALYCGLRFGVLHREQASPKYTLQW